MSKISLHNASFAALFVAPISPAIHLGFAAYLGAVASGMPTAVAIIVGASMAITVELVGIASGHMLATAIAARNQPATLRGVAGLVAIYVILGMSLSFGAEIWGGIILPAGAFILASLVYVLRGMQEGSEVVSLSQSESALQLAGENERQRLRQEALDDADRQHARDMERLAATQKQERALAKVAAPVQEAVQPAVQKASNGTVQFEQMSVQDLESFVQDSPTVIAHKYGISRGTVYNRRPEAERILASHTATD